MEQTWQLFFFLDAVKILNLQKYNNVFKMLFSYKFYFKHLFISAVPSVSVYSMDQI